MGSALKQPPPQTEPPQPPAENRAEGKKKETGLFDTVISEKSLDEVILGFLAEEKGVKK